MIQRTWWYDLRIWIYRFFCRHEKLYDEGWEGTLPFYHCPKCGKAWDA